ncbi:MAG: phosphatidate cytidylyltransferase [Myxococcota bacterium]
MSNLMARLATAAVAVPLILALMFAGPAWGWLVFVMVATAVGAHELFGMTYPGDNLARGVGIALTLGVVLGMWFGRQEPRWLLTAALLLPFASILLALGRLKDIPSSALRLASGTFGPMWLGMGMGATALIRVAGGDDGAGYLVLTFVLSWIGDTGGYFAGRAFGKHKLYESVSPKKTVEGAMGGVAACVAGAVITHFAVLRSLPIRDAVILGVLGSILGIFGDLGESLLKRSVGVKDSGGIVPGHGGILDRVDATMITSPLVLLYLIWFR